MKLTLFKIDSYKPILGLIFLLIFLFNGPFWGVQIVKYIYFVSIIYFFLKRKRFSEQQKKLLVLGSFLALYGFSYTLIRGVGDFNMFGFSRLFTSLFTSVLIVDLLKKNKEDNTGLLKWLSICAMIQAAIVLIGFVSPSFKDFILLLCGGSSRYADKLGVLSIVRGIGWTYAQFSDFAVAEGLAFLAYIALCVNARVKRNHYLPIRYYLGLFLCIVSGLLIGRTFQIIIIIGFLYYSYCGYRLINFKALKQDCLRLLIYSISVIGTIIIICWDQIPKETLDWAFEAYTNLSETKKIETASTDELQTMWILPPNTEDVILGTGRFENPNPKGHPTFSNSDVGLVNSIFYWGILGSLFYYLCIYLCFRYAATTTFDPILKYLSYAMLIVILIYNVKGLGNGFSYACLLLEWNHQCRKKYSL